MNRANTVIQAPSYEAVVNAYDIAILKPGGDFQVTSTGALHLTKDRTLKLGDDRFNAMFRLVERWRLNSPTLAVLFEAVANSRDQKQHLVDQVNGGGLAIHDTHSVEAFRTLNDEIGANEFGCAVYAGAIMLVLSNLLLRFKIDLNANDKDWKGACPLIEGCSVGSIVQAAANNFRHHDEWARTDPPKPRQLRWISTIAAILKRSIAPDGSRHPFRYNACPEIIEVISGGDYERLNRNVFTFANRMVSGRG